MNEQETSWAFDRASVATREEQRVSIVEEVTANPERIRGRLFLPQRLVVTLERERHSGRDRAWSDWGVWRVISLRLEGVNVRADGSAGADRIVQRYDLPQDHPALRRGYALPAELGKAGTFEAMRNALEQGA